MDVCTLLDVNLEDIVETEVIKTNEQSGNNGKA